MRLIDGDAIIDEYCGDCAYKGTELCGEQVPACGTAMWIVEAPTVDAVEVVRCKDCKYWDKATVRKGFLICPASGMEIMADDYCSYGERKTNGKTN